MERLAEQLVTELRTGGSGRGLRERLADLPSRQDLEKDGLSPIFACYAAAQHVASAFAEHVSHLPALSEYGEAVGAAEDLYWPEGPPTSPLTTSYFTLWALFDHRFGPDGETLGDCLLAAAGELRLDVRLREALSALSASRMGVYAVETPTAPGDHGVAELRELLTEERVVVEVPAGQRGTPGELWFARVCPPIPGVADHGVVLTTPYVLLGADRSDWCAYLRRAVAALEDDAAPDDEGEPDDAPTSVIEFADTARVPRAALRELLKHGPTPHHWHEFVMRGYCSFTREAVHLTGIPDRPETLPHA